MLCLAVVATAMLAGPASADSTNMTTPTIVTPDKLTWSPIKGVDGAWMAVIYGDPTKAGSLYTMRIKLADGTKVPMHTHNDTERVTVLSGSVMFGANSADMSQAKTYGPGTFVLIPAGVPHWVVAKGETILQSTGMGPFAMNMK